MPTPAYTELNNNAPDGAVGTGTTYSADDLANVRALRDMAISGRANGFVQTRTNGTGTANQPQYIQWIHAVLQLGFRMQMTWTGFFPTTVQWQWTNDNGTSWANMGSAQVNTVTSDNITASTNSGGFVTILFEVWGKCLRVVSDLATHLAVTTGAHGTGDLALQDNDSVDINGGAIDGTPIGNAVRAAGSFTRVAEDANTYTPALNAAQAVDWAKGGSKVTHSGTNALTFSNIPSGFAGHILDLSNLNNFTFPPAVDWGAGGKPSIAGRVLVVLVTDDVGAKIFASASWQAV